MRHEVYGAEVSDKYVKAACIQSYDPFGSAELSVLNVDFAKTGFKHGDMTDITITCEERKCSMSRFPMSSLWICASRVQPYLQ